MTRYEYSREIVNGSYNINNVNTADVDGNLQTLSSYVEAALPAKAFKMSCCGNVVAFEFEMELLPAELTDLENCINAYKAL